MKLHEIAGALTTFGHETIWEYYNGGVIAARREAGIFCHWEQVMNQILGVRDTSADRYFPCRTKFLGGGHHCQSSPGKYPTD
jgi:hypothetical protein